MFFQKTELKTPDAQKILEDAGALFKQLGIQKPEPEVVSSADGLPPDLVTVLWGEIILPSQMIGRLTPEEWRPLVASSIIFNYLTLRRQNRGAIPRIILILGGAIAFILVLARILDPSGSNGFTEVLLVTAVFPAVVALTIPFLNRYSRGGRFKADREAARIVGRESMLQSLTRVRDLREQWNLPRGKRSYRFAPSLDRRIANLQRET
jgi:hypothetical protein